MNLVFLFMQLKFLELWFRQKMLAPCCACTCGKRPKHFIEDANFETRQRCGTCPPSKQNREVQVTTANDGEHLSALITFKFSAKITHIPGILTPGDFHLGRSDSHMIPSRKSPDVMVSVSSGENHPTLSLVWVRVKIIPRYR